jgi:phage terminase Nu1 subunit (DNA packaging protein)
MGITENIYFRADAIPILNQRWYRDDEAYYTRVTFRLYFEEADNEANKDSALI